METPRFTPEVSDWSDSVWFIHDSGGDNFSGTTHLKAETYFILNGDRPWLNTHRTTEVVWVNLHNTLTFPSESKCQYFIDRRLSGYSGA